MTSIDLILSPNLRTSSMKTSRLLKDRGGGYEMFLLNFPMEMEEIVMELAAEHLSYDEFIDEVGRSNLIPEPQGSWEYLMRPILETLPQLAQRFRNLTICCYGSLEHEFASMKVAVRLARLTLRTAIIGEVEFEKWRDILRASRDVDRNATEKEATTILEKTGGKSICISDLGGRHFKRILKKAGLDVKIQYVEKFYHFTPLMILKRKWARGPVEDEELEELVRRHVEYVRSYIYRFGNRDRAYYEWVHDKIPWSRRRFDKEEIELLDRLISDARETRTYP